jgi:hypothetical protein
MAEADIARFSKAAAAARQIADSNAASHAVHEPGLYDGDVLLFVATTGKLGDAMPARAWEPT